MIVKEKNIASTMLYLEKPKLWMLNYVRIPKYNLTMRMLSLKKYEYKNAIIDFKIEVE